jgi:hypothetical protein
MAHAAAKADDRSAHLFGGGVRSEQARQGLQSSEAGGLCEQVTTVHGVESSPRKAAFYLSAGKSLQPAPPSR